MRLRVNRMSNNQYPQQYPVNPAQNGYPSVPSQYNQPGQMSQGPMPMGPQNQTQQAVSPDNQLVRMATPLITLITQIRHTVAHPDVASLRNQVVEEVNKLEQRLTEARYSMRTITASRYCLCTAVDEAVLSQPWGTNSVWVEGSLLSIFQKETWGGERFYIILEDALRDTRNNIDFIEFIYFLMSLGFEGKLYGDENRAVRDEVRNRIFYHIRHARMKPERNLSLRWKNSEAPESERHRKSVLRRVGIMTGIVIVVLGIFYNASVYHSASPTLDKLNKLAQDSPVTTFSQVIERPIVVRDDA